MGVPSGEQLRALEGLEDASLSLSKTVRVLAGRPACASGSGRYWGGKKEWANDGELALFSVQRVEARLQVVMLRLGTVIVRGNPTVSCRELSARLSFLNIPKQRLAGLFSLTSKPLICIGVEVHVSTLLETRCDAPSGEGRGA